MKTYILTLSKTFPTGHIRAGEPTYFKEQMGNAIFEEAGIGACDCCEYATRNCEACGYKTGYFRKKRYTIRANYPLWERRFAKIERGEAYLSVRQWTSKPYRSKQVEIARLTKEHGIGIQKLTFAGGDMAAPRLRGNKRVKLDLVELSRYDGLSYRDWCNWFKKYDLTKPLAIIHFTEFRY